MQLNLRIPPAKTVVVEIEQTKANKHPGSQTPADLAVCKEDINYIVIPPHGSSERDIRVHNIGCTDARDVEVAVYLQKPGGHPELIETGVITSVDAAVTLDPQYTRIGIWGHRGKMKDGDTIIVKVDPDNKIHELNEQNNIAKRVMYTKSSKPDTIGSPDRADPTKPATGQSGRGRG